MIKEEEVIIIGKFQKTHALKGELNMICDIEPEYFQEGNPLIVKYDGIMVPYYIESIRQKGTTSYLVKISGIETEEEASLFVNKEIGILKKDAEEWLDEELVDSNDFIGYTVVDYDSGTKIGEIKIIDDSTANLLFIVENNDGEEIYIPANNDLIRDIDEDMKSITMILPEGIVELNKSKKE